MNLKDAAKLFVAEDKLKRDEHYLQLRQKLMVLLKKIDVDELPELHGTVFVVGEFVFAPWEDGWLVNLRGTPRFDFGSRKIKDTAELRERLVYLQNHLDKLGG